MIRIDHLNVNNSLKVKAASGRQNLIKTHPFWRQPTPEVLLRMVDWAPREKPERQNPKQGNPEKYQRNKTFWPKRP